MKLVSLVNSPCAKVEIHSMFFVNRHFCVLILDILVLEEHGREGCVPWEGSIHSLSFFKKRETEVGVNSKVVLVEKGTKFYFSSFLSRNVEQRKGCSHCNSVFLGRVVWEGRQMARRIGCFNGTHGRSSF